MLPPPPRSTLFPYTTLFRSHAERVIDPLRARRADAVVQALRALVVGRRLPRQLSGAVTPAFVDCGDRKSTRLNSSHQIISYAVFCLKKKKKTTSHIAAAVVP